MQESTQHNNIHSLQLLFTSPALEIPKLVALAVAAEVLDSCEVVYSYIPNTPIPIPGPAVVRFLLLQKLAYSTISGRWANKNQSIDVCIFLAIARMPLIMHSLRNS